MSTCVNDINIPNLQEEVCDGVYTSDTCIVHSGAITYLGLPANSSVSTILTNMILSLMSKDGQIAVLVSQVADLTTRVETLENP